MTYRHYTPADRLLMGFDQAMRTVFGRPQVTERPNPAEGLSEAETAESEQAHTARLMRINHTGEVCAQALYQGQALTAKLPDVRNSMERAAQEENDHLNWCEGRIKELGSRKSLLNPLWYTSSFMIGATAGLAGDKWSLGFLAETENQVVKHLEGHLQQLPDGDDKSHTILEQMKIDEARHKASALNAGGSALPDPVKKMMTLVSRVMTTTASRI